MLRALLRAWRSAARRAAGERGTMAALRAVAAAHAARFCLARWRLRVRETRLLAAAQVTRRCLS